MPLTLFRLLISNYFLSMICWHDHMKIKVMRDNSGTLQAAVAVANAEQNLGRRFDLRSGYQL